MEGPTLTHLDKIYWPKERITKGELVAYYREVAPVLVPFLKGRPESLNRHPDGIEGESFFQKDIARMKPPPFVRIEKIRSASLGKTLRSVVCDNEETLLWMANLGCIEIDPWTSRVGSLDSPDFLVIDLDPEGAPFANVIEAALAMRRVLEGLGLEGFPKTSGGRGLHVYVPMGARYATDDVLKLAELLSIMANDRLPETTSLERSPRRRKGKVYFDFLQNRHGATTVAPYSVRPRPGALVSAPLEWKEVRRGLDPAAFTMKTMPRRLDRKGDLFKPVLGKGADVAAALKRLGQK
ncbi:MAG TPA: non-homologous end-joining DNA ligase [Candidatus Binatia bacterium]|jgi:bifunctional non-homologous end joining protein LigD|nr:non-homologous end-joining DNA ligase [Candidatus Binatia bacterium]